MTSTVSPGFASPRQILGHAPVLLHAHADRDGLRAFGIDDGIGAPLLLPVDLATDRDVLARLEPEIVPKRRRHGEGQRDRIVGDVRALRDDEGMEPQHAGRPRCT